MAGCGKLSLELQHYPHAGSETGAPLIRWLFYARILCFRPTAFQCKFFVVNIITLTTDFGTRDWFVGTMKGVILLIQPRAQVVDITHEIAGGQIRAGAFALMASYSFFPRGTVHVAVIDPGVGGPRRAIAVQTANYFFVGS